MHRRVKAALMVGDWIKVIVVHGLIHSARVMASHHQLRLCRTLRVTSDGDFFSTIHSIIVVAADSAYLGILELLGE